MADLGAIVEVLAERFGAPAGPPEPLSGGITNHNYRVQLARADCVVRLTGANTELLGISREAEWLACERAASLGLAPEPLAAGDGWLATRYIEGEPPSDPAPLGAALRRFHDSGLTLPMRFWVPDLYAAYAEVVRDRGGTLPPDYGRAWELVDRIAVVVPLRHPVPCHDDLLPGNLLRRADGRIVLIDWEYAGMGHALFDLANLTAGHELDAAAADRLLAGYDGTAPSPGRSAALALMRIVSDAREAAWGVVQGVLSELDFDFAGYAAQHFERLLAAAADPRLPSWLEVADGATP